MLAKTFHCSPLEIPLWPEERLELYMAFLRGEQRRSDDAAKRAADRTVTAR